MTKGISKSDLCWVLVKLLGAVLIYQGGSAIYTAALSWWWANDITKDLSGSASPLGMKSFVLVFLSSLLPLVIGLRLIISGMTLHGWLMSVPLDFPGEGDEIDEKGLPFSGEELEQFKEFLQKNPEVKKRERPDQVALFRDAQNTGEV